MPRARDLGINIGEGNPGPSNAITDVPGVRVGYTTLIEGENIRTGVTVILPFEEPGAVFAGLHRLNGLRWIFLILEIVLIPDDGGGQRAYVVTCGKLDIARLAGPLRIIRDARELPEPVPVLRLFACRLVAQVDLHLAPEV